MRCRSVKRCSLLAAGVIVGGLFGCADQTPPAPAPAAQHSVLHFDNFTEAPSPAPTNSPIADHRTAHVISLAQDISQAGPRPADAAPAVHEYFKIDAYQITVPIGTLGRNEDLWKQINEQCVDVGTYDLLFKNGLRVGVAPMSAFDLIKTHLPPDAQSQKIVINGVVASKVQLETRKDLIGQEIFHFDGGNNLVGRTYDRCTNLLDLSFEPTPRQPGSVRVDFAPVVRAYRARLEFSVTNEEREIQYVVPETFYDLNCRADIPLDHFLILAPSSDADRLSSVGHAFLTSDASPVRMEQVHRPGAARDHG